jgi:putative FmdB family regulatory protein
LPTYEYQCPACACTFERRQRFDDEPVAACPRCSARSHRVFHSVPILFKGSGFYCTDNSRVLRDGHSRHDGDSDVKAEPEAKAPAASEAKASTTTATASQDGD